MIIINKFWNLKQNDIFLGLNAYSQFLEMDLTDGFILMENNGGIE